ncbi:hypothetical protein [uncultured Acinetobacter sp.]|uniref:hypothetical protein n=1 Tax=uncultured Acinetobacter sp. TaxID=165433 RepID=UPI00263526C2|nr:hypothetical protein [uncultured Acinetobacter sp.]
MKLSTIGLIFGSLLLVSHTLHAQPNCKISAPQAHIQLHGQPTYTKLSFSDCKFGIQPHFIWSNHEAGSIVFESLDGQHQIKLPIGIENIVEIYDRDNDRQFFYPATFSQGTPSLSHETRNVDIIIKMPAIPHWSNYPAGTYTTSIIISTLN